MIRVTMADTAMTVQGHANAAPKGADLVCCAVSMLVYTLAAGIGGEKDARISLSPGRARISCAPTRETRAVFTCIGKGLALLAAEYPQYIRVEGV